MKLIGTVLFSLLFWAIIIVAYATLVPAFAQGTPCMAGDANTMLQTWVEKTGQHPLLSFNLGLGDDNTTPAYVLLNPSDGHITILYRGPNNMTCFVAVGTDAKASPAETVVPKEVPKQPGTAL